MDGGGVGGACMYVRLTGVARSVAAESERIEASLFAVCVEEEEEKKAWRISLSDDARNAVASQQVRKPTCSETRACHEKYPRAPQRRGGQSVVLLGGISPSLPRGFP